MVVYQRILNIEWICNRELVLLVDLSNNIKYREILNIKVSRMNQRILNME